jgi:replicative DNA helicase
MSTIYSLRIEKHVLGGIINHPSSFYELDGFVTSEDFFSELHATVFKVIKSILLEGEHTGRKLDEVILAQKIKNLGLTFKDDIDVDSYIKSISFSQITKKATIETAKELVKLKVRRNTEETARELVEYARKTGESTLSDFITGADKIYSDRIYEYVGEAEPSNLFENIDSLIEERGNHPNDDPGLLTSYDEFNRLYGGLRPGNLYAIASRPGQGKTTWINDMLFKTSVKNNIKALILDTEMSKEEMQFRMTAAISGVPVWYLETGNWRKNREMMTKVREALDRIKDFDYTHFHVGNKDIDQVCNTVKRWYYRNVGRGNPCIIGYDYVKLTGEKVDRNWAEYQAIGDKIDKLKKLSEELNCPILTAMQLNRQGESHNRNSDQVVDDSSVIALSDRLQWFSSYVGIFRRKTLDEIAMDGQEYGTHKLVTIKSRFQGRDAAGHQDLVRRVVADGSERYVHNYLNFNVDNFDCEELGSLQTIVQRQRDQHTLEDQNSNDADDGDII